LEKIHTVQAEGLAIARSVWLRSPSLCAGEITSI